MLKFPLPFIILSSLFLPPDLRGQDIRVRQEPRVFFTEKTFCTDCCSDDQLELTAASAAFVEHSFSTGDSFTITATIDVRSEGTTRWVFGVRHALYLARDRRRQHRWGPGGDDRKRILAYRHRVRLSARDVE